MAHAPTRSACFQPDNYKAVDLFANRHVLLDDVVETLKSFLDEDGPGEGRVLVRGHRGVGKSMLMRKAIDQVVHELHVLRVEVDCAETVHGEDAVLRALCAALCDELLSNVSDPGLRAEAEMLRRLSDVTKIRAKDVKQWSTSLKFGLSYIYKLADKVQFEFGLTRAAGRSREVEETTERAVDATFLQKLVLALLEDCARVNEKIKVVVFIDNLDQAGYAEIEEDVRRVTDLARYFFTLKKCLVVATMRTEFVSADLNKLYSNNIAVSGMKPDELCEVVDKRMKAAGKRQQKALEESKFRDIAKTLARFTDNAWGFLTWLAALDYASFEAGPDDVEGLVDVLAPLMQQQHPGLREEEIERIARAFEGDPNGFLTADALARVGIEGDLRDHAIKYMALVPDWLLSPDRYMLSPRLHFLTRKHPASQA
jgi:Cdc6-like AAA superfamily ATPase